MSCQDQWVSSNKISWLAEDTHTQKSKWEDEKLYETPNSQAALWSTRGSPRTTRGTHPII